VDVGDDIVAVDHDRLAFGRSQGHVEDRPSLGGVDALTPEHGLDPRPQAGLLGQRNEQIDGLGGDPVLGVVDEQVARFGGQSLAPGRVSPEEVSQMEVSDVPVVFLQGLPLGRVDDPLPRQDAIVAKKLSSG
jgi:hypothetical protein